MSDLQTQYDEQAFREAAKQAKLRYVKDTIPGITRKKKGANFHYFAPTTLERITSEDVIGRINALAIPPAYAEVWICPMENGHLQATGRDARQRKQYRYHPKWKEVRSTGKYEQIAAFTDALPAIRSRIARDMAKPGLPRERVLASIVYLMDRCHMRVGNAQYAAENNTYGLTTIRKKHVEVDGNSIHFEFVGKSGKLWERDITSKQVASIVKRCEELPGQELFKYLDKDGGRHDVTSDDVNGYLQEITGMPFTAKDFRTWVATAQAIRLLGAAAIAETDRERKQLMTGAIKEIAAELGHTPAICRQCYIHPNVLSQYEDGSLQQWYGKRSKHDDHALVSSFLSN